MHMCICVLRLTLHLTSNALTAQSQYRHFMSSPKGPALTRATFSHLRWGLQAHPGPATGNSGSGFRKTTPGRLLLPDGEGRVMGEPDGIRNSCTCSAAAARTREDPPRMRRRLPQRARPSRRGRAAGGATETRIQHAAGSGRPVLAGTCSSQPRKSGGRGRRGARRDR